MRAPRRTGRRTTLTVPASVFEQAESLAQELATTVNDAIVRLALDGAAARARKEEVAALAAERRAAVDRSDLAEAAAFPSPGDLRAAMLAGRRDP